MEQNRTRALAGWPLRSLVHAPTLHTSMALVYSFHESMIFRSEKTKQTRVWCGELSHNRADQRFSIAPSRLLLRSFSHLWCAVPASGHVLGQEALMVSIRRGQTSETEVADLKPKAKASGRTSERTETQKPSHCDCALRPPLLAICHCADLEIAVGVEEQIGWLEISVARVKAWQ